MAATNVQAFSGDVEISSNLEVGTANLFVDTVSGRVGIGVTNPQTYLHLNANNSDIMGTEGDNVGTHTLTEYIRLTSGGDSSDVYPISAGFKLGADFNGYNDPDGRLDICANNGAVEGNGYGTIPDRTIATFLGGGRVGIGTDSPSTRLQVNGESAGVLGEIAYFRDSLGQARVVIRDEQNQSTPYIPPGLWTGSGGGLAIGSQFDAIKFYSTDNGATPIERMRIAGSGYVGIGTNPARKLHVEHYGSAIGDFEGIRIANHATNLHPSSRPAYEFVVSDIASGTGIGASKFAIGYRGTTSASRTDRLVIDGSGNVGIRTTFPNHPLSVFGQGGNVSGGTSGRAWFNPSSTSTLNSSGDGSSGNVGVYAESYFMSSTGFLAQSGTSSGSDYRIKKDIVDADDLEALETLRLLKPKRYKYKDEKGRGTVPVWGFIAQEVAETLPYSITLTKEFIPNIYEMANVSDSNVITFTNFNTSNLESNASAIRSYGKDDAMRLLKITEVIDEHSVRVDQDLSEWTGSFDESGNVVAGNQLFVYGEEIDDFHFLKKDSIWTVATSALQEVDRQLQAEKAKVASLEARVLALESA